MMKTSTTNQKNSPSPSKTVNRRSVTDVVGLEVGADLDAGTPAVRIRIRSGEPEIAAAGFLPIDSRIPHTLPSESLESRWLLPKSFCAPSAAIVVNSADSILRQAVSVDDALSDRDKDSFRTRTYKSRNGSLSFVAAMPEKIASWAASLLPEGRKPTACSIQISALARLNAFAASETFSKTNGKALVLIVGPESSALVIFDDFEPLLYREHSIGSNNAVEAVSLGMNLDRATSEKILNETLVDPTSMLEPALGPLFRQAELSVDYATRKSGSFIENFYLCGLMTGARYWAQLFREKTGAEIVPFNPVLDYRRSSAAVLPDGFEKVSALFTPAIGAAMAVLEDA